MPVRTIFLGDIVFIVDVSDDYPFFDDCHLSYYVDDIKIDDSGGSFPLTVKFSRNELKNRDLYNIFKHKFNIKFEAVDNHGNKATEEMTVWKFF